MMVNTEHMQQWIDALRSGEYTQITGWLETRKGQCAEGVACREALKAGVKMDIDARIGETTRHRSGVVTQFDCYDQALPPAVRDWLGLNYEDEAWIETDQGLIGVADANDHGASFADIADGLYKQYLKEPDNGQH